MCNSRLYCQGPELKEVDCLKHTKQIHQIWNAFINDATETIDLGFYEKKNEIANKNHLKVSQIDADNQLSVWHNWICSPPRQLHAFLLDSLIDKGPPPLLSRIDVCMEFFLHFIHICTWSIKKKEVIDLILIPNYQVLLDSLIDKGPPPLLS